MSTNPDSQTLQEVMDYIKSINIPKIIPQNIEVICWDLIWQHELTPSVSKYLFEDLNIIDNIAPEGNSNRPGGKHKKCYICVHDTADGTYSAKQWNQAVYDTKFNNDTYAASYQYVVGNDGYYHNMPDDETAYHAGDGAQEGSLFKLYETKVYGSNKKPHVSISTDGYYTIDGEKTIVVAPKKNEEILSEKYINDLGIYTTIQDGQYYIGNTWYSATYNYIANKGGNLNSIGIESCVNKGSDVHLTWQRVAKLVAKLMDENNLGIDAIVQHHYFSGKNCPQTMRKANKWEYFLDLVSVEYQMRQYMKLGFKFEFKSNNTDLVNEIGRVINIENTSPLNASYTVKVKDKDGNELEETFSTLIEPKTSL